MLYRCRLCRWSYNGSIAQKCPHIEVTVVDINEDRIAEWNSDQIPVYIRTRRSGARMSWQKSVFSADVDKAILESEMIFLAVNTPTKTYGIGAGRAADLRYVENCARQIAKWLKVIKSSLRSRLYLYALLNQLSNFNGQC